ncbi:flagellar basal body P-ring formation chaperone FlgA [Accumulibacter sp.]|jgi:flagella basal body P-ring formation protein FlgA|uniref:Flagella basal body P-ring formation protein FlgA n=1 Tax=Accumulibacter regalis TaxID=522306 RepID=C7RLC6_ACCRE|nr:flagellar basal body P-ring formation chaperone FlgA [Accumulibacter sp.]MBN8497960.1 flagellar basal body P-ring formation protein FlgA [Accumulibacter sp.]MBO3717029.1 flagellar basal body P-ring formation protein FlgA [Accumulibacter sp.]
MSTRNRISPLSKLPHLLCALLAAVTHSAVAEPSLAVALDQYLTSQTQGLPGKVSYSVGPLDQFAKRGPCSAFEPFLPVGSRLWGKTTVGIRCLGPTPWTVYVPVQVRVAGTYLLTARQLTAGQIVADSDVLMQGGDLGALPAGVLTDPAQARGKTVRSSVAAGQPLRGDLLIAPWSVQQGQSVKLVSTGTGFTVSNEGKALNNASEGQVAQVRTASGQVVSGVARGLGIVEVTY